MAIGRNHQQQGDCPKRSAFDWNVAQSKEGHYHRDDGKCRVLGAVKIFRHPENHAEEAVVIAPAAQKATHELQVFGDIGPVREREQASNWNRHRPLPPAQGTVVLPTDEQWK